MRKKIVSLLLAVCMLCTCMVFAPVLAKDNVVSPGKDTLKTAVQNASAGDVIMLTDGVYSLSSTLTVNKAVTIQAEEGTHPIISGGETLTGWENYQGNIYRVPFGGDNKIILTEGNSMGEIARYPNRTADNYAVNGFTKATNASGQKMYTNDIPQGITADNLEIFTWGDPSWATTVVKVTSIGSNYYAYTGSVKYGAKEDTRFYVRGDKALIDAPGEFAVNGGYLYYYPIDPAQLNDVLVSTATGDLIKLSGSGITLDGLAISTSKRGSYIVNAQWGDYYDENYCGVNVTGSNNTVQNCEIYSVGGTGVMLKGSNNTVCGNYIHDIGSSGIQVSSSNNNVVTSNKVTNTGFECGSGAAIGLGYGSGNEITHNDISIAPRWAINMNCSNKGSNNLVEYNNCYNCNTESSDTGVIYTYTMYGTGNTIRNNAVHDSNVYYGFGFGIYLDDGSDAMDVSNNLVYNLQQTNSGNGYLFAPVMVKGIGSRVVNNVVVNNKANGGGDNNSADVCLQWLNSGAPLTKDNTITNNIFAANQTQYGYLYRVLNMQLKDMGTVNNNLYYKTNGSYSTNASFANWSYAGWQKSGLDTDSLCTDPRFVDRNGGDYRLQMNSPAYDVDFEDLNMEDIGLTDAYTFTEDGDSLKTLYVRNTMDAGNRAWALMKQDGVLDLAVKGRTEAGLVADLSNVSFTSDHPEVADVDAHGTVTAYSDGTAVITAQASFGGETKTTTFTVTVKGSLLSGSLANSVSYTRGASDVQVVNGDPIPAGTQDFYIGYSCAMKDKILANPNFFQVTKNGQPVDFTVSAYNGKTKLTLDTPVDGKDGQYQIVVNKSISGANDEMAEDSFVISLNAQDASSFVDSFSYVRNGRKTIITEGSIVLAGTQEINVNFTEDMNVSTVNDQTIVITKDTVPMDCRVSLNGKIATVTLDTAFEAGSGAYTITVKKDAETVSGLKAENDTTIFFTVNENVGFEVADTSFRDVNGNEITKLTASQLVMVDMDLISYYLTDADVTLILALQNEQGQVIDLSYATKTAARGETFGLGAGMKLPSDISGLRLNLYLWDSMNTLHPIQAMQSL